MFHESVSGQSSVRHLDVGLLELQLRPVLVDDGVQTALGIKVQHLDLVVQVAAGPAAHHHVPALIPHGGHLHGPENERKRRDSEAKTGHGEVREKDGEEGKDTGRGDERLVLSRSLKTVRVENQTYMLHHMTFLYLLIEKTVNAE